MATKKTWNRGRKPGTQQQRADYADWSQERVRIANLVSRNKDIEKICCICGKEGQILHNKQDPYYIAFICKDCRKDPHNLIIAEENRFDIRTKFSTANKYTSHFTDETVRRIIVDYMNSLSTIGEYCDSIGISRYQFNQLIKRYNKLFPKQQIKQLIKNKSKRIQREKVIQRIEEENILK